MNFKTVALSVAVSVPLALGAVQAAAASISPTPATGTPSLPVHSGPQTQEVRQVVQCGGTVFAVGQFSSVVSHGTTYSRQGGFAFSATPPYNLTSWDPRLSAEVNTVALAPGCSEAWLGTQNGMREVSATTGARNNSFDSGVVSTTVNSLVYWHGHLLAGGGFPGALYSLTTSGHHDGFTSGLDIHGNVGGGTKVYNMQVSPNGKRLLAEGDFTRVGGHGHQQVFELNLDTSPAKVTGWRSGYFSDSCIRRESFFVRSAAWSPDGNTIYVADTGDHAANWHGGELTGLCDVAAAFPTQWRNVNPEWRNFTGCDSYYSVAATSSAVFAAGHQRWVSNRNGCNRAGPGAVPDSGLAGFTTRGSPITSGGSGTYSMSAANADDMLVTSEGLWIASSNRFGSQKCGGQEGHTGLCLLPSS